MLFLNFSMGGEVLALLKSVVQPPQTLTEPRFPPFSRSQPKVRSPLEEVIATLQWRIDPSTLVRNL